MINLFCSLPDYPALTTSIGLVLIPDLRKTERGSWLLRLGPHPKLYHPESGAACTAPPPVVQSAPCSLVSQFVAG